MSEPFHPHITIPEDLLLCEKIEKESIREEPREMESNIRMIMAKIRTFPPTNGSG